MRVNPERKKVYEKILKLIREQKMWGSSNFIGYTTKATKRLLTFVVNNIDYCWD